MAVDVQCVYMCQDQLKQQVQIVSDTKEWKGVNTQKSAVGAGVHGLVAGHDTKRRGGWCPLCPKCRKG